MATCSMMALTAAPAVAQDAGGSEIRRDPKGIKGISPYNEDLAKGRKAFQDKNYDGAIAAFKDAIGKDGERMDAYLLMAQAQLAKGAVDDAVKSADDGRSKAGTEPVQAKMIFFRAEASERKSNTGPGVDNAPGSPLAAIAKKWQQVKTVWTEYSGFVDGREKVQGYKASSDDRALKVDARVKRDNDFAVVRKRIVDNEKERAKKKK
jgi:hypothetical protein